jgi:hypothetical protein
LLSPFASALVVASAGQHCAEYLVDNCLKLAKVLIGGGEVRHLLLPRFPLGLAIPAALLDLAGGFLGLWAATEVLLDNPVAAPDRTVKVTALAAMRLRVPAQIALHLS